MNEDPEELEVYDAKQDMTPDTDEVVCRFETEAAYLIGTAKFVRWDVWWKCENKRGPQGPNDERANEGCFYLPEGTDLQAGLAALVEQGFVSKGSHRAGVYEVQNERGIYSHREEKRLLGAPAKQVKFTGWDDEDESDEK